LRAAGLFDTLLLSETHALPALPSHCLDFEAAFLKCLQLQALCQAQEITIARAARLGHKASLIAALCADTAAKYSEASAALKSVSSDLELHRLDRFDLFLAFKAHFYTSTARFFQARQALDKDSHAAAGATSTASSSSSSAMFGSAADAAVGYSPGAACAFAKASVDEMRKAIVFSAKLDQTPPKTQEACANEATNILLGKFIEYSNAVKRDNDKSYYDTIPSQTPAMAAPKSLVKPIPFFDFRKASQTASFKSAWSEGVLQSFEFKKIPEVVEKKQKESNSMSQNNNDCNIS